MLKYIINFYRVSMPRPCNRRIFVRTEETVEAFAMVYFFGCNLWVWFVLCLSVESECNEEAYCG